MNRSRFRQPLLAFLALMLLLVPTPAGARRPIALGLSIAPEWGTSDAWWDTELDIIGGGRGPAIMSMWFAWKGPYAQAPHQEHLHDTVYQPTGYPSRAVLDAIYARGAVPMLNWQPNLDPDETLQAILDGRYDAYIRSWAEAAAADGRPVLLRFAQEMNGVSFQWAAGRKGNDAASFRRVWRKVHRAFDAAGATRVRWVWAPIVRHERTVPFVAVWPGSRFVDVIGLDGYNWYTTLRDTGRWRSFAAVYRPSLAEIADRWPGKPVIITEVGSVEPHPGDPYDKGRWIRQALLELYRHHPQVVGFVYFDIALHGHENDVNWRFDTGPTALAAWRWATNDARFRGRAGVLGIRPPR